MNALIAGARVLVTGATGGVGEALVRGLVNDGATVLVHGRDPGKVEALAAELRGMGGGDAQPFVVDLASLAEVARLAREVRASGPLTVLVNNAGMALHPGTFLATKMVLESGITPRGTPEQGADAVLAVIERALNGDTGKYFERSKEARADASAYDPAMQERLRRRALALTAASRGAAGDK